MYPVRPPVSADADYQDIKYIRPNSTPSQAYLHDKFAGMEGANLR
ncbi:hypothetical protein [Saccharopolyspora pogona]|nr:hypothetical protein [Saccharopolyspora pogona]